MIVHTHPEMEALKNLITQLCMIMMFLARFVFLSSYFCSSYLNYPKNFFFAMLGQGALLVHFHFKKKKVDLFFFNSQSQLFFSWFKNVLESCTGLVAVPWGGTIRNMNFYRLQSFFFLILTKWRHFYRRNTKKNCYFVLPKDFSFL